MSSSVIIVLGLALATGVVAIVTSASRRRERRIAESLAYLKGVRYVLSDAPDAAIDQLTRAAALNPGTQSIETYFALGKLFRRKGDLERAIRLHQNILLRPGLPNEIKQEAQFELAIDLQRAGLLSRAVEAFEKYLVDCPGHPEALRLLRDVREDARDLEGAAEVQIRVVKAGLGGETVLAHLLASAARQSLAANDPEHALALAEGALKACPASTDALQALAEASLARGDRATATARLAALLESAPQLALELEPLLQRAFESEALLSLLAGRAATTSEAALHVAHARALSRIGERSAAAEALRRALVAQPGFNPARRELGALLLDGPLAGELMPAFEELLRAVAQPEYEQHCTQCGHTQAVAAWRCPRCRSWDTLAPQAHPPSAAAS